MDTLQNTATLRRVTRLGVYGVAIQNRSILLALKKGGCYKGLLDLPGGGVEFGENAEETLRREVREEVGMTFETMEYISNLSHTRDVLEVKDPFSFHQLGQCYRITGLKTIDGAPCEEEFAWYPIDSLDSSNLTPFAQHILMLEKGLA